MPNWLTRFRQRSYRLIFTPQHPLRRLANGLIVGLSVGLLMMLALWANLFTSTRTQLTDSLYAPRATAGRSGRRTCRAR